MKTVTATTFRNQASEFLDDVENGETVAIQRHGKTVAHLVPAQNENRIPAWKKPGLKLQLSPGTPVSRIIIEEREKEES